MRSIAYRTVFFSFIGIFLFASLDALIVGRESKSDNDPGNPNINKYAFSMLFSKFQKVVNQPLKNSKPVDIFLCGDVMLGRGIDQVLPYPSEPVLYERYMKDARGYVEVAEHKNGPIPSPVPFAYVWGDALEELERIGPDLRIINLETSITKSNDYWKDKGINYRMNPKNIPCLTAANIDFCSLANNHVLDWGYSGLSETLETLNKSHIKSAGAGNTLAEAESPAILEINSKGRVLVFSYGTTSSGIPLSWAAIEKKPGINLLRDLSENTVRAVKEKVNESRQKGDVIVVSIHWGENWGYQVPRSHITFAHQLIDEGGVDIIHGHSSHHVMGIEVYNNRLILYGCGDFINDYEGITSYEQFRDDLALMYFASLEPGTGKLIGLKMTPMQIKNFRLNRATKADAKWIADVLNREGKTLGTRVQIHADNTMTLQW